MITHENYTSRLADLHLSRKKLQRVRACRCVALACLCAFSMSSAYADEDDAIVTDRPDFVESSNVVGVGRFQIETGFASERNSADGQRTRTTSTPTLLRVGLNTAWELRAETEGRIVARNENLSSGVTQTERGYADLSLGLKWHMQDEAGMRPSMALLAYVDLATGSRALRGEGVRPSVRMVAEWDLPNEMSLGVMPGVIFDKDAHGDRFTAGIFGIVIGKSWTDKTRTFVELAASQIARANHGGSLVTLDVGAAYMLSQHWQLDVAYNKGLNRNTPDSTWTAGLSAKF